MMTKEGARLVDSPFRDEPSDARAADDELLVTDGIDLLRAKPVARAKAPQHGKVARAIVAEEKIRAHPDLSNVQPFDEHGAHKGLRIPMCQFGSKADDSDAVHARAAERIQLLLV